MRVFSRTVLTAAVPAAAAAIAVATLSSGAAVPMDQTAHTTLAPSAATALKIVKSSRSTAGGWAEATCPAGTGLVGGGWGANNTRNSFDQNKDALSASTPSSSKPNTWATRLNSGKADAYAMCSPGAPVPKIVAAGGDNYGTAARATCPQGMVSIGGGFDAVGASQNDFVQSNSPDNQKANTWLVEMMRGESYALVMCVK